jgi:hypothetical protein
VIRGKDIRRIVLGMSDDGVSIRLPYNRGGVVPGAYPIEVTLQGEEAMRAISTVLPAVNVKGGTKQDVQAAVQELETSPDPVRLFQRATNVGGVSDRYAARLGKRRRSRRPVIAESETFIDRIPRTMLLAMEMAAHEDVERRAMEGELAILEAAWRQAEEIAAISDNLLVPATVDEEMKALAAREPLPRGAGD